MEWKKNSYVKLVANPGYWRGAPKVQELYFELLHQPGHDGPGPQGRHHRRRHGLLDAQYRQLLNVPGIQARTINTNGFDQLAFNCYAGPSRGNPALKDWKFRQALNYGALLLSAVNTAVADMVSIQYVMSRNTELPHVLTRLNLFGVPWLALIAAVGLPVILLNIFQNVYTLANLYAVGVVGAIAINLGSCSINRNMPVKKWERTGLVIFAIIMIGIEATLVWRKPDARYFAMFVLGSGLAARFFTKTYPHFSARWRGCSLAGWAAALILAAGVVLHFQDALAEVLQAQVRLLHFGRSASYFTYVLSSLLLMFAGSSAVYAVRYLTGRMPAMPAPAVRRVPATQPAPVPAEVPATPAAELDMDRPHILVATRGGRPLLEFAASYAKDVRGILFILFVRQINVAFSGPVEAPSPKEDPQAGAVFQTAAELAKAAGVPMIPIYVVSPDVAYSILDFAATYSVKALLMGVSRKGTLLRALQGDVITSVADNLPSDIPLLVHA